MMRLLLLLLLVLCTRCHLSSADVLHKRPLASLQSNPPVFDLSNVAGSFYDLNTRKLYSVETGVGIGGKLARTSLYPTVQVFKEFTNKPLDPLKSYDVWRGDGIQGGDVIYDTVAGGIWTIRPQGNCEILSLGVKSVAEYNAVDVDTVATLTGFVSALSAQPVQGEVLILRNRYPQPAAPFSLAKMRIDTIVKPKILILIPRPGAPLIISSKAWQLTNPYEIIGQGYQSPQDVVITRDGVWAYISEDTTGMIQKVQVQGVNGALPSSRPSTPWIQGLHHPRQLALDEDRNRLYVVEYRISGGRLIRIDLTTRHQTVILSNLYYATGLVIHPNGDTLYISQQTGGTIRWPPIPIPHPTIKIPTIKPILVSDIPIPDPIGPIIKNPLVNPNIGVVVGGMKLPNLMETSEEMDSSSTTENQDTPLTSSALKSLIKIPTTSLRPIDWNPPSLPLFHTASILKVTLSPSIQVTTIWAPVSGSGDTLTSPYYLSWYDNTYTRILIPQHTSPSQPVKILTVTSRAMEDLFNPNSQYPASVRFITPGVFTVAAYNEIALIQLTPYVYDGPILLGIGNVPITFIDAQGYADTTSDPNYFYQVQDSPFGGTLSLMFNHDRARAVNAKYYEIYVDGAKQTDNWGDEKWNPLHNRFEWVQTPIAPGKPGRFEVRKQGDIWYNYWLGYNLNTYPLSDMGLRTIAIKLLDGAGNIISISQPLNTAKIQIDNTWPEANITKIYYYRTSNMPELVGTCGIIQGDLTNDAFTFEIQANDPDQNLYSYSLWAVWGDNKSGGIFSDNYAFHVTPTNHWAGVNTAVVPLGAPPQDRWHATYAGDPTSTSCAHTFFLGVWDRAINGYSYIHYSQYHKSLTLLLK